MAWSAGTNIMARLNSRQVIPRHGGVNGARFNRRFLYSRFKPLRAIQEDYSHDFTCAMFPRNRETILLGTNLGEVKEFNFMTGQEKGSYSPGGDISMCQCSKDSKLLLTSSTSSALWAFGDSVEMRHSFSEDSWVKFSNLSEHKIIGTYDYTAHVYDTATGERILSFNNPNSSNEDRKNIATFNPTDDLILNDGVLWDVNGNRVIHEFDRPNNCGSGVFHPSGLEIVISSEIWDLRSFRLLDHCPSLEQCRVIFNNGGDVMYGVKHLSDPMDFVRNLLGPYESSFQTVDATDHQPIETIDVNKMIFDLCTDITDCFVAVIEKGSTPDNGACQVYEVGRIGGAEDEQEPDNSEDDDDDDDYDDVDDDNDVDDDDDDDSDHYDDDSDNDDHDDEEVDNNDNGDENSDTMVF